METLPMEFLALSISVVTLGLYIVTWLAILRLRRRAAAGTTPPAARAEFAQYLQRLAAAEGPAGNLETATAAGARPDGAAAPGWNAAVDPYENARCMAAAGIPPAEIAAQSAIPPAEIDLILKYQSLSRNGAAGRADARAAAGF